MNIVVITRPGEYLGRVGEKLEKHPSFETTPIQVGATVIQLREGSDFSTASFGC